MLFSKTYLYREFHIIWHKLDLRIENEAENNIKIPRKAGESFLFVKHRYFTIIYFPMQYLPSPVNIGVEAFEIKKSKYFYFLLKVSCFP